MTILTHTSGVTVDTNNLPEASRDALWAYGFNHYVGNVQQARRTNAIRAQLAEAAGVKPSAITTEAVKAWNSAHTADSEAMLAKFVEEAIEDLNKGTVGLRESKPRVDERTKRFNTRVLARIRTSLGEAGLTLVKDLDHVYQVPRPDGTFVARKREDFIKAMIERRGPEIYSEVDAEMAREAESAKGSAVDDIV